MIFLVSYDRHRQRLTQPLETFEDEERGVARKRRLELQPQVGDDFDRYEIVMLEAPHQRDIELTHARYFAKGEHVMIAAAQAESREVAARLLKQEDKRP